MPTSLDGLTRSQRATITWLRRAETSLAGVPLPGRGATLARWEVLIATARTDLARARLVEGHLDAHAILAELRAGARAGDGTWGVWTAEPDRVRAERCPDGWRLVGEKRWCSGAGALDHALVTATADDGPRLFIVEPARLEPVAGSWPAIGMEATASLTMRFDVVVHDRYAVGAPHAYVGRPGFWHGGAGVAACWFGGALGVAERLRIAAAEGEDRHLLAVWGLVAARLEAVGALLRRGASEIDDDPQDVDGARDRAMRLRLVVEDVARFTVAETTKALGAGPLAHEREYARQVVDLELYLRQLRPEAAAGAFGAEHLDTPVSW